MDAKLPTGILSDSEGNYQVQPTLTLLELERVKITFGFGLKSHSSCLLESEDLLDEI